MAEAFTNEEEEQPIADKKEIDRYKKERKEKEKKASGAISCADTSYPGTEVWTAGA
jgi:hypothetical protein